MEGQSNPTFENDERIEVPSSPIKKETILDSIEYVNTNSITAKTDDLGCGPLAAYARARDSLFKQINNNPKILTNVFYILLNIGIIVYLSFATKYYYDNTKPSGDPISWCNGYGLLIIVLAITYFILFYYIVLKRLFNSCLCIGCAQNVQRLINFLFKRWYIQVIFWLALLVAFLTFLVIDSKESRRRLVSLLGIIVIFLFGFLFSSNPGKIKWRQVMAGITTQIALGLLVIRWEIGRLIVECFGNKVAGFLSMTNAGSSFVFGNLLVFGDDGDNKPIFAFSVLPVIFFVSFCISILYYYGIMQKFVLKMGWLLGLILNTTICESVNAAANIFLGMTESMLLLKPYLQNLTSSELHSVMASGFATVSGSVMAAYINYGAEPSHLITASVMAAPASLCFTKLFYPETEESQSTSSNIKLEESQDTSVLDAASKGASAGIEIVLGVIANVVAFVAFVGFLNVIVSWLGGLVGYDYVTFEWILAKIFMPLSWLMGVPWEECEMVSTLIGMKAVINEFAAFERLGTYKDKLSKRAFMIATYSICGFANPGSLGIMIGSMSTLLPHKRHLVTKLAVRAFISGTVVCMMTASVAGMLVGVEGF